MFCNNCGNQLGAGNAYCPNCGTKQGNNMPNKDYVKDAIRGELRGLRRLSIFLIIFMSVSWALSFFGLVLGKTTSTSNQVTRTDRATAILSPTPFHQTVTSGTHIIKIQTGTGFDPNTHTVQGEAGTFVYGEKIYIVFTVQTHDSNAQVDLQLFQNNQLEDTTIPIIAQAPKSVYSEEVDIHVRGENMVEVDYSGIPEATITFNII